MKRFLVLMPLLLLLSSDTHAQKLAGDWYGKLQVSQVQSLNLVFHVKDENGQLTGTWDSPDQGASGQEISTITVAGDSVTLRIDRISATYRGRFTGVDSIVGVFEQSGKQFPLNLGRTQTATVQYPNEKMIEVTMRDSAMLYGMLLAPKKTAPLVIIVAGSGPTDMNQNGPSLKTNGYLMLAHALDSNGIGTFRYDKRGIGRSSKAMVSERDLQFKIYVNDLADIINHFKHEGYQHIFVAGHSEGSLIALIAAQQTTVEGIVSIAGAGLLAAQVLAKQIEKQPMAPALKTSSIALLDSLETGKKVQEVPKMLESIFRKSVQPYLISWFQYDPRKEIAKVDCPVLILQGNCDIQISVDNATNLFNAAPEAQIEIIKGMSHVLKDSGADCKQGMKGYYDPAIPLATGLVAQITDFVKKN